MALGPTGTLLLGLLLGLFGGLLMWRALRFGGDDDGEPLMRSHNYMLLGFLGLAVLSLAIFLAYVLLL
ncbi:MAG: hypothetical protein ACYC1C_18895 [Chloroflexota bacterium]